MRPQTKPFYHVNFAHRGLHDNLRGIPENSIAAFQAAVDAGYGVELDVQLSRDGEVVVFHDDTLNRVCGIKDRVDAYPYAELKTFRLCGTEETIPLFSDVLQVLGRGKGAVIVELKNGPRNRELCEKTTRILQDYPGLYCIESFNPLIVWWFRRHAPGIVRGQLACPASHYSVPRFSPAKHLLAGCRLSFLNRPDFIAYQTGNRPENVLRQREKGVLLFAWTSREPDRDQAENDAVIFEGYRPAPHYEKKGRKEN